MEFGKMQIVNLLAAFHGHTALLEISTGTTGRRFSDVDSGLFQRMERLAYNLQGVADCQPVDFLSDTLDIAGCVAEIRRRGRLYDIVFVDPYHDYVCSKRDIDFAYGLLSDDGTMVVHDCLPPTNGDLISPTFVDGSWCGVTFIAYVDFLMKETPRFATIDCDYGCGIIRKTSGDKDHFGLLCDGWSMVRQDPEQAYRFLSDHKSQMLNLQSPYEFLKEHFSRSTASRRHIC